MSRPRACSWGQGSEAKIGQPRRGGSRWRGSALDRQAAKSEQVAGPFDMFDWMWAAATRFTSAVGLLAAALDRCPIYARFLAKRLAPE